MTGTLISLISIVVGIAAANLTSYFKTEYSFGFTGDTLIGVFGSILLIKSFGRLGFDAWAIMDHGTFHPWLFALNMAVSAIGGSLGLILTKLIMNKVNQASNKT